MPVTPTLLSDLLHTALLAVCIDRGDGRCGAEGHHNNPLRNGLCKIGRAWKNAPKCALCGSAVPHKSGYVPDKEVLEHLDPQEHLLIGLLVGATISGAEAHVCDTCASRFREETGKTNVLRRANKPSVKKPSSSDDKKILHRLAKGGGYIRFSTREKRNDDFWNTCTCSKNGGTCCGSDTFHSPGETWAIVRKTADGKPQIFTICGEARAIALQEGIKVVKATDAFAPITRKGNGKSHGGGTHRGGYETVASGVGKRHRTVRGKPGGKRGSSPGGAKKNGRKCRKPK